MLAKEYVCSGVCIPLTTNHHDNPAPPQEADFYCSSGEITPLSSLTASFTSSPLSSHVASDDEQEVDFLEDRKEE